MPLAPTNQDGFKDKPPWPGGLVQMVQGIGKRQATSFPVSLKQLVKTLLRLLLRPPVKTPSKSTYIEKRHDDAQDRRHDAEKVIGKIGEGGDPQRRRRIHTARVPGNHGRDQGRPILQRTRENAPVDTQPRNALDKQREGYIIILGRTTGPSIWRGTDAGTNPWKYFQDRPIHHSRRSGDTDYRVSQGLSRKVSLVLQPGVPALRS